MRSGHVASTSLQTADGLAVDFRSPKASRNQKANSCSDYGRKTRLLNATAMEGFP
jgi:hypothetical protein